MSLADAFKSLLRDPPPAVAIEVCEAGVASAAVSGAPQLEFRPLARGTIEVSPVKDNILDSDRLFEAIRAVIPAGGKRRTAALVLPDNAARLSVLDFDNFPTDVKEQASLVRFRLKKSVPYEVDSAVVSYDAKAFEGKRTEVIAAIAPLELVARYEAPLRFAGLEPGFVTSSALAALALVADGPLALVAKVSGRVLTLMAVENRRPRVIRSIELEHRTLDDIGADLFQTVVFIEDQLGKRPERVVLIGFGAMFDEARARFGAELGMDVEAARSKFGAASESNAGLLGYLEAVMA